MECPSLIAAFHASEANYIFVTPYELLMSTDLCWTVYIITRGYVFANASLKDKHSLNSACESKNKSNWVMHLWGNRTLSVRTAPSSFYRFQKLYKSIVLVCCKNWWTWKIHCCWVKFEAYSLCYYQENIFIAIGWMLWRDRFLNLFMSVYGEWIDEN